jgi:uncharacterized protein YbjT (DUF2867 family)
MTALTNFRTSQETTMYVLMGANGNITSRAARALLQQGHAVRVIGRSEATLAPLRALGAELAIGDAQQADFLTRAFTGATAVYAMIPPDYAAPDMRRSQALFGTAIAAAIAQAGVKRVINLSSVGAELAAGTGPIAGLHDQEHRLDTLVAPLGLQLLHLRPGYFMENHLHAAGTIAALGVYPSLERGDVPVPTIATADIADVVARELVSGQRGVLHLHAPRAYTFTEVAAILGRSIGRPDLPYVQAERAQGLAGMAAAGFSAGVAELMAEMAAWLSKGTHAAALPGATEVTPTTLEDFAPRFREACEAASRATAAA